MLQISAINVNNRSVSYLGGINGHSPLATRDTLGKGSFIKHIRARTVLDYTVVHLVDILLCLRWKTTGHPSNPIRSQNNELFFLSDKFMHISAQEIPIDTPATHHITNPPHYLPNAGRDGKPFCKPSSGQLAGHFRMLAMSRFTH